MSENYEADRGDRLSGRWRSSTVRLIAIYGAFFLVWSIVRSPRSAGDDDSSIAWSARSWSSAPLANVVANTYRRCSRRQTSSTCAASCTSACSMRRRLRLGQYRSSAENFAPDGQIRPLPNGRPNHQRQRNARALGVAMRLPSGDLLVLARYTSVADRIGAMTRSALGWALSLLFIPGLLGGFLLSRGPFQRVRNIETSIQPIMRGDLGARLPVSGRRDELDMLASIVNRMLLTVSRLLGEVKGVSDNIAHDLRTPLTRLRAQLYRLQTETDPADARRPMLEQCIVDTDALLDRFRALLRISELEDLRRRAGFAEVDIADTLRQVH
jgi:signal transduction histidine kinase